MMCFSTEASFTAAVVLAATGVATLKHISSRSQFFLAAIPLLFAIQQFSEGLVWLHLSHYIGSHAFFVNTQRAFLTFAFLIWPIWIPLSFLMIETIPWRRILLFINLLCGLTLSIVTLTYAVKENISVQVIQHSLQYMGHVPNQAFLYPVIVLLPMLISSFKNAWIFGILVALGYVIADYFYTYTFASVWCFFAAIVSISIYKIIKDHNYSLEKKSLP
jgi:hypothetical protein